MLTRLISLAAVLTVFASAAFSHQFWIQPMSFFPATGENIAIRLMVGDGFPGEARPRDPTKLERFVVAGTIGTAPILGNDGEDPAGIHRFERNGVQALGYRGKNSRVELEAVKFEKYLAEEGFQHAIDTRKAKGDSAKPGRELYSRCAKSLVCVGEPASGDLGFQTNLKLPLEITPLENPYLKSPGESIVIVVTNESGPVADAVVTILHDTDPKNHVKVRTDKEGHATMTLGGAGVWMASCVQMTEAPAGSDAEWQSVWSSLTFEVRERKAGTAVSSTPVSPTPVSPK